MAVAIRYAAATRAAAPAILRTQVRALSSASSSSSSSSSLTPQSRSGQNVSASGIDNPLMRAGGSLGVSALARPAGRQSVSGIVATVFGGSGFLGRYVVNHLGRIGSQVVTPYRSGDGMNVRHLKLAGDLGQIVPIPFDMSDMDGLRRCVARSNVVINLIGSPTETVHYGFDDVHGKIAYRLAQVSKAMGVERFVHVSAVGASADSESRFFRSKAAGEANVREFFPDATIIRPTVMFGAQDNFLSYYAYMGAKLAAIPMTRGGQRVVEPVFVADVARAILNSLADPGARGQTYELSGPERFTEEEIIALVSEHTVRNIRMFDMSDSTARLYGSAIGGRRGLDRLNLGPVANTVAALLSKFSIPSIYHHDLVAQRHTDLVASGRFPNLSALGVETAVPLRNEIERALLAHRAEAVDRFPEAEKMKKDAKDTASF